MGSKRKKRQRIFISTPYPDPKATAKMFGLSKREVQRVEKIVEKVTGNKKKSKRR